jgi:hypothetical protein
VGVFYRDPDLTNGLIEIQSCVVAVPLLSWSFIINQAWYNVVNKTHLGEQSNMVTETITLEDIKRRPLEEVLREVAEGYINIVVQMPDGEEVVIEPKPRLKPLPVLEGYIPEGWKDAVYADK